MTALRQFLPESVRDAYGLVRARALSVGLDSRACFALSASEKRASAKISVVVPVHDAPEATLRCLTALTAFAGDAEVILVDDGSKTDVVKDMLVDVSAQNSWTLIRHESPSGHSRACEAGVSVSTRPFICLLNSDAIVGPRSWNGIIAAFESDASVGVAGPSTSVTVGPQVVRRAFHCRHYWSNEQIWSFADRYVARHQHEPLLDLAFVGGFAFFVRRTIWRALGGFDKNLPDYGNEMEFCRRVVAAGVRIVWSKGSYVHHLGKESYGRTHGLPMIRHLSIQANHYIARKHGH